MGRLHVDIRGAEMYRKIVASRTRAVWRAIDAHDLDTPWRLATPDLRFRFVGDSPLGADLAGRDAFRAWLASVMDRFPDLRFEVKDIAVNGWPWRTRIAVRLGIRATLADGSIYRNHATQWLTLRWGRMTDDWVLEDTVALNRACSVQDNRTRELNRRSTRESNYEEPAPL
jgi:ketosteroid isomerase-like protein